MKKRTAFIFSALIATVLALSFVFSGCATVKVSGTQDTSYVIQNNGAAAVRYGNYVYFINGYRGYDDPDADANVMGKVEKGGLYRAELLPSTPSKPQDSKRTSTFDFYYGSKELNVFNTAINKDSQTAFKTTPREVYDHYMVDENGEFILNDDDEKIGDPLSTHFEYDADVDLIASKTIGTSGYEAGGIFIFDNYVFYASPNNKKNSKGDVQSSKIDFYRSLLDGSKTQKIYTTKTDDAAAPYMFYKWQDSYYLAVKDGTEIVSVKMGKKIGKSQVIAGDITTAYFPNKGTYYNGINENGVEDFVYYTRAAGDEDPINSGSVLEMMRPDGSEGILVHGDGNDVSILNCDNGILFYEIANYSGGKRIVYDNLFNTLMGPQAANDSDRYSPTYYAAYKDGAPFGQINGSFSSTKVSNFTNKRGLYPNYRNVGEVFVLGYGSDGISLYSSATGDVKKIYNSDATYAAIEGNVLYFYSGASFKSVNLYEGGDAIEYVSDAATAPTYKFSLIEGYVMYFGKVDDYADNYALFKSLNDPSAPAKFVGYKIDADKDPAETEST